MIIVTLKRLFLPFFLLLNFSILVSPPTLYAHALNIKGKLPAKFRNCKPIINASGSAQFSEEELRALLQNLRMPIIIVDLRAEPHCFINGICVNGELPDAISEKTIVEKYRLNYLHFKIPDGGIPTDADTVRFISLIQSLNPNTWLHFHCAAGRGRTTLFLVMYDMLLNAKQISFNEIIRRQYLLGGVNLVKIHKKDAYECKKRLSFLKRFYCYCRSR